MNKTSLEMLLLLTIFVCRHECCIIYCIPYEARSPVFEML